MSCTRAAFIGIVHQLEGAIYQTSHLLELAAKPALERTHVQVDQLMHYLGTLPGLQEMPLVRD